MHAAVTDKSDAKQNLLVSDINFHQLFKQQRHNLRLQNNTANDNEMNYPSVTIKILLKITAIIVIFIIKSDRHVYNL